MSDVFISYAHSTAREARAAAETLRTLGYTVWLDEDLPAHRAFRPEIEQQLTAAKAALVFWSADAAKSEWVLSEASWAREARKLVQVRVDRTRLPMPFDQIQCTDLAGWSGDGNHPGWAKVAASVAHLVKGSPRSPVESPAATPPASEPLLAVLAFDNLSGDPEMAYFSDGVSEEILDTVARGSRIKVIARSSSFQFRGADKAVKNVVADLKATHLLDGSVRRSGSRVRIAARLVDCASETTVWSGRYDRDLTDIFELQDEIAIAVAAALNIVIARPPRPALIDPATFDLFLRAKTHQGFAFDGASRQIRMLEEVVGGAPDYARGWAALAHSRAFAMHRYRAEAAAAGLTRDQVVEAAELALRLDPQTGRAYQALALIEPPAAYRARDALNDKALAAAPNDPEVIAEAGMFYGILGRVREALAFVRRAYELDPLDPSVINALGIQLIMAGRTEESGRLFETALARWPDDETFAANAIASAAWGGDRARAESLMRAWSGAAAGNEFLRDFMWSDRNLLHPDPASIKGWLRKQRAELERTGILPLNVALRLQAWGLADEAFELIDKASFAYMFDWETPGPAPLGNTVYPGVIFIRVFVQDPRFPRLCAKLGLCNYWIETEKWPDCADKVPYDFRAEARKAAGLD